MKQNIYNSSITDRSLEDGDEVQANRQVLVWGVLFNSRMTIELLQNKTWMMEVVCSDLVLNLLILCASLPSV